MDYIKKYIISQASLRLDFILRHYGGKGLNLASKCLKERVIRGALRGAKPTAEGGSGKAEGFGARGRLPPSLFFFKNKMMKPVYARRPDVHSGAFADCF